MEYCGESSQFTVDSSQFQRKARTKRKFNAEAQRTQRFAEKRKEGDSKSEI
jgi:hypothetical protein